MPEHESEQLALVRRYRRLVEEYEALDARIDELIMASDGSADKMSAADLRQYRQWARERSEKLNAMRRLERQLDLAEDEDAGSEQGA